MSQHLTLFRQYADIEIGHEHDYLPVLVRFAHTDVVKPALVPKRHRPAPVDPVPAYPRPFRQVDLGSDVPLLL